MRGLSEENGILEDHLHLAAQRAQLGPAAASPRRRLRPSSVRNRISPAVGVDRAQDAARGRRLAAAALADQRQRLALADVEADVVDRAHVADDFAQEAALDRERTSSGRGPRAGSDPADGRSFALAIACAIRSVPLARAHACLTAVSSSRPRLRWRPALPGRGSTPPSGRSPTGDQRRLDRVARCPA